MSQFKTGDVVVLKSGSPIMTVNEITIDGKVKTTWFVNDTPKTGLFQSEMLEISDNSDLVPEFI